MAGYARVLRAVSMLAAFSWLATAARAEEGTADLNRASMRVSAVDTIYGFDLSVEQLKTLKAAAEKTASTKARTAAKENAALATALKDFEAAMLAGKDGATVARLRGEVMKLAADVELDDDVEATAAAMSAAPAVCRKIKASQIAAFLALHADQVSDPVELMNGALAAARDLHSEAGGKGATETEALIRETATSVSYLVCGTDEAKAKKVSSQVTAWLKAASDLPEKTFVEQQASRDSAAAGIVGDVDSLVVLGHWLDLQVAVLLSNPELPAAIDKAIAARAAAENAKQ